MTLFLIVLWLISVWAAYWYGRYSTEQKLSHFIGRIVGDIKSYNKGKS